ncbi:MAG: VanZ family protein [Planctomycetaceae bacterium]|nr:VanZ family protein [Planctomycetaceae bacterium]
MTRRLWQKLLLVFCAGGWAAAFIVTHLPAQDIPSLQAGDKVLHVTGYFLIACAFGAVLIAHGVRPLRRAIIMIVTMGAYGIFDELTQPLFGRSADSIDWFADMGGTILAVLVLQTVTMFFRKKISQPSRIIC